MKRVLTKEEHSASSKWNVSESENKHNAMRRTFFQELFKLIDQLLPQFSLRGVMLEKGEDVVGERTRLSVTSARNINRRSQGQTRRRIHRLKGFDQPWFEMVCRIRVVKHRGSTADGARPCGGIKEGR